MTTKAQADRRLVRLTKICAALPEAARRLTTFLVRNKTFAYYLDNHHGDGIVAVCCKMPLGENMDLVKLDPVRFYLPAYIGPKSWIGLRVDLGDIDCEEVTHLVINSFRLVAPKRLASQVL